MLFIFFSSITAVCSILGLIGFIFSICFAFTVAAESGALAGLGAALIFKLFAFEVGRHSLVLVWSVSVQSVASSTIIPLTNCSHIVHCLRCYDLGGGAKEHATAYDHECYRDTD